MRLPFAFMKKSSAGVYNPAVRSLTSWHRTAYSGSPWSPTASAGTSGSNGNQAHANPPSAIGGALNGLQPASFDAGLAHELANATAISSLVSNTAGSIAVLFHADAADADTAASSYYNHPALFSDDTNGFLALTFNAAGCRLGSYNGATFNAVTAACSTGAPHLVQARWNSTTKEIRVDSGAWATLAHAVQMSATDGTRMGVNYIQNAYFDGKVYERMTESARWSDAEANDIKAYMNARYALAL